MIIFLTQEGHRYTHRAITGQHGRLRVECRDYRWALNCRRLPHATYIFTDRERMDLWEVPVLSGLYRHLAAAGPGYRVVNDPAQMKNRRMLLRSLHHYGINAFDAYAATEHRQPQRYPVFLRREHDHAKPLTDLLASPAELDAAIATLVARGESLDGVLVIEYCAEPITAGLYRKLAAYRLGPRMVFFNTVHETSWLVKYGTLNAATEELYLEEQQMVRNNAFEMEIRTCFERACIEYGRADFGLVAGQIQLYEINTNPSIALPKSHPNATRTNTLRLAWERYLEALTALDTTDARGPLAASFEHPRLRGRRQWLRPLRGRFIAR